MYELQQISEFSWLGSGRSVCELRSEVLQLKASAVLPHVIRDLEVKVENQQIEIQRLQRDQQTTQDSLNSWDEVNLSSIQGVCVDESVATSPSTVSLMTEPAITHQKLVVSNPELFRRGDHSMPKTATKLAAAPSTPPASLSNAPMSVPNSSIPTFSRAQPGPWLQCVLAGGSGSVELRSHDCSAAGCSWCTSGGDRPHRGRAAADRRIFVARLWSAFANRSHLCTGWGPAPSPRPPIVQAKLSATLRLWKLAMSQLCGAARVYAWASLRRTR